MARVTRNKPYHMLAAYAKTSGYSIDELAQKLSITRRTFDNKVHGRSEFTLSEALEIKRLLGKTIDEIFLQK